MKKGWKLNHTSISKYHGLMKIELNHLSHPKWIFLRTPDQLPEQPWTDAPVGWTIRCCPKDSYEFGLPSKHMLKYGELNSAILEFSKNNENKVQFVVYPSWEFDVSGCCLIENKCLTVEAIKGDIAPLLRGLANPDVVFEYTGSSFERLKHVRGSTELLSIQDQQVLVNSCRRIELTFSVLVLEWTKTIRGELYFHDWLELK